MTKQLEKNMYLLDRSEKNILIHPRNPAPPPEIKRWPAKLPGKEGASSKQCSSFTAFGFKSVIIF